MILLVNRSRDLVKSSKVRALVLLHFPNLLWIGLIKEADEAVSGRGLRVTQLLRVDRVCNVCANPTKQNTSTEYVGGSGDGNGP